MNRGRFRYWLSIRWRGELRFALWFAVRYPFGGGLAYLFGCNHEPTPYVQPHISELRAHERQMWRQIQRRRP